VAFQYSLRYAWTTSILTVDHTIYRETFHVKIRTAPSWSPVIITVLVWLMDTDANVRAIATCSKQTGR